MKMVLTLLLTSLLVLRTTGFWAAPTAEDATPPLPVRSAARVGAAKAAPDVRMAAALKGLLPLLVVAAAATPACGFCCCCCCAQWPVTSICMPVCTSAAWLG